MKFSSPKVLWLTIVLIALVVAFACRARTTTDSRAAQEPLPPVQTETVSKSREVSVPTSTPREIQTLRFEIVNTYPHDSSAFTQGLVFRDGVLFESTGQYGQSSLRKVELKTGRVLKKKTITPQYFAEGITLFQGKIYQLTWTTRKGFIYDPESFDVQGEFSFDGEGWGLTHDDRSLILSDGTNQIRFLDPSTFEVQRTISVKDKGRPIRNLNELEYVKGEIYANIWHNNRIVRIDPRTGNILGWIDLAGLLPASERRDEEAVLNGIAYDEVGDRLFITGKLWPKLFEIRLKK